MDKYSGVAQDSAGNLITAGTAMVRVTLANSDTLASIFSSDSLSATKANPFTLPTNGKIEFHGRNGKVRIKLINGSTETPVDEVVLFAGVTYGTLAARPAAGSADRIYVATDVGRVYYDNGSAWKDVPDYSLDAQDWYAADDVVAAATSDVFGGKGNYVEVTHASGTLAITALSASSAAVEGSPRLVKFTITGGTLTLTHNATSLEIMNGGSNVTLANGDMLLCVGKGGNNVRVFVLRANPAAYAHEVAGAGQVIQTALTEDATAVSTPNTIPHDDTIPQQNTEGAEYTQIATTITPKFANSKLRVRVFLPMAGISTTDPFIGALFRDSTADAIAAAAMDLGAASKSAPFVLEAVVDASAATATTFKFRYGITAGTAYIGSQAGTAKFGASRKARMTVEEIKQ